MQKSGFVSDWTEEIGVFDLFFRAFDIPAVKTILDEDILQLTSVTSFMLPRSVSVNYCT